MGTLNAEEMAARIRVWDAPLRIFHWLLVLAIGLAFLSSEEDSALNAWHIVSGWIAGLLIIFRIAWGFLGGEHSRFASFVRLCDVRPHLAELLRGRPMPTLGHNPLGALSVLVLLGLILATVLTGAILYENAHETVAWTLLAVVGLHIAAVAAMSFMTRENLVGAMISGSKSTTRHPAGRDARPPRAVGLAIALLVLASAAYAVRAFDPLAFTLRSVEAFELNDARLGGPDDSGADPGADASHEGGSML